MKLLQRRIRVGLLASSAFIALGLASVSSNAFAQAATKTYEISQQDLGAALRAFALTSGRDVVFDPAIVRGKTNRGVQGRLSDEEALGRLLDGSDLIFTRTATGGFVVRSKGVSAMNGAVDASASSAVGLGEVVVTAQKRSEVAQKVPITLTAFGAKDLQKRGIEDVRDLASFTPGFNAAQFSYGKPIFAIRGAENTFSAAGATKPVGVFIDEVYVPRFSASNFSLFDVQSVSVLKGPQGTLFGRNVTAGAILVQTREPSLSGVEADARVGFGNYGLREASGYFSAPLSQNVAGSLSLDREVRDGFGRDILNGRDEDDADSWTARAQLLFRPNEGFKLRLSADYGRDKNGGRALSAKTNSDSDRRTSELGVAQSFDRDVGGASARMEFGDGPIKFTSLTGYRYSDSYEIFSRSGIVFSKLANGFQEIGEEHEQDSAFSQEGRIAYQNDAVNVVGGLFYFQEDSERGFRKYRLAARTGATILDNFYDQDVKTTSTAPFADATWHVNDGFDLTGGVRYTYEHKDAAMSLTAKSAPATNFSGTDKHRWTQTTYRAVATYRPSDDLTLYGSYATGFTAGGYNTEADVIAAFRKPFNPEKSANFELGLKSRFADGRGRFNVAAFSTKYNDKQEFVFNQLTFVGNIINAAQATARGIEADIGFTPIRVLTLNGTFAYLDGKYDRFEIPGAASATGNDLGNSPKVTYSLSADLDQPLSWGRLLANISLAHKGSYHASATLPDVSPATDLLGAQVGVGSLDQHWRLMLWGRNLTNELFPLITSTTSVNSEWLAPPRTYGVRLSYQY